ncbi:acriflavin resistance protein [Anopheles sinensis]|uniref:Acriflavin resistance protein n=1 Tax=Anopheles sinensis TaxID=74873 RepID=A0A084VKY3_ANOSI|nr:acriflavin resistance protein [Anopheles sinensis]
MSALRLSSSRVCFCSPAKTACITVLGFGVLGFDPPTTTQPNRNRRFDCSGNFSRALRVRGQHPCARGQSPLPALMMLGLSGPIRSAPAKKPARSVPARDTTSRGGRSRRHTNRRRSSVEFCLSDG